MPYNPDQMPTNETEWQELIDHYVNKDHEEHLEQISRAGDQAAASFDANLAARRDELIAALDATLAAETVAGPEGPEPLQEADRLARRKAGIAEIDAQLAAERQQAVDQAVSMVEPARPRSYWEQHFACYRPQEQPPEPVPTFAELKQQKLAELGAAFYTACQHATVTMDGITYDADETANRNVAGLLTSMEAGGVETVQFCAADNSFHELTLEGLRNLQLLIVQKGQALYAAKWQLRTAIEAAEDEAALAAIVIGL